MKGQVQGWLKSKRMPKISVGYNVIFEYKRMRLFLSVYSTMSMTLIMQIQSTNTSHVQNCEYQIL